jgi:protein gp37
MTTKSNIAWTNTTWSPVTGCTKVSDGCKHCYAEREVETRWSKNPKSIFFGRKFTDVQIHPEQLDKPLHWKKPQRIFVCPRADLFHESVPDEFIDKVFAVMALAPQHVFQVLTKRPGRMLEYMSKGVANRVGRAVTCTQGWYPSAVDRAHAMPLPNVWIGVSVENQATADERIPLLLQTPAAVRWVSAEPLLGPINLMKNTTVLERLRVQKSLADGATIEFMRRHLEMLDWVIAGGESGPHARPMHPDWARTLRDQCQDAGVPFFFKQWGEWIPMMGCVGSIPVRADKITLGDGTIMGWAGTKRAGRRIDGVLHDEYPKAIT